MPSAARTTSARADSVPKSHPDDVLVPAHCRAGGAAGWSAAAALATAARRPASPAAARRGGGRVPPARRGDARQWPGQPRLTTRPRRQRQWAGTSTSSGWISARCPPARSSSAPPTAPRPAPRFTSTPTRSWIPSSRPPASRCPRTGRCRTRRTTARRCAPPCRPRSGTRGSEPGAGHRHRHRLHREHGAARAGGRDPAVPARRPEGQQARLCQALEAPCGPAARGPDQRSGPRARRVLAASLWREDIVRMAVRQGPAAAGRGARAVPAGRALDRGGRLDHLAARRARDQERLHGWLQGHPAGRQVPVPRVPGRAGPPVRDLRRQQAGPSGGRARHQGRLAHRAGGGVDRPARGHRGRGGQRGRARHRAGRPAASSRARWSPLPAPPPAT